MSFGAPCQEALIVVSGSVINKNGAIFVFVPSAFGLFNRCALTKLLPRRCCSSLTTSSSGCSIPVNEVPAALIFFLIFISKKINMYRVQHADCSVVLLSSFCVEPPCSSCLANIERFYAVRQH